MKTTLNEIKKHYPCFSGWNSLLKHLNKTESDDEPLELTTILEANGIKDTVWALRCFDYSDYCLFLADIAESVLAIYEKDNKSDAPRLAIKAIRDYKSGIIKKEQLSAAADSAYATAHASDYAHAASNTAAHAAATAADATANTATYAAYAYTYADDADVASFARSKKWEEIERLFIKHLKRSSL